MKVVGFEDAGMRMAELLKEVQSGERFTITREGIPVATLAPVQDQPAPPVREVIADIRRLRKGNRLAGMSVRELIEEGRRH